jgi:hypothetical protein
LPNKDMENQEVYIIIYEGPGDRWHGPQMFFCESEEQALEDMKRYPQCEGRVRYVKGVIMAVRPSELVQ